MLVHKKTFGVLQWIWTGDYTYDNHGAYRKEIPIEHEATLEDIPEEERDEYFVIDAKSSLGKKLTLYYPDVIPIYDDDGNLVDVKSTIAEQKRAEKEARNDRLTEEAEKRGYKNRGRVRPKNLMSFLK